MLAGLLHEDAAKRQDSLKLIELHVSAYDTASSCTLESMQQLLSRHPLSSLPMKFAAKFLKAAKFQTATPQLVDLCNGLFSGVGQTKLVEDAFQKLRDHETRDSAHKMLGRMQAWEDLVQHKLWAVHGREEVSGATAAATPANFGNSLFVLVAKAGEGEFEQPIDDSLQLSRIMGSVDWVTFDAQSQMERVGAVQHLLSMHVGGKQWHLCDGAWKCSLVPEGHLVTSSEGGGGTFFIVRSFAGACLAWPCVRLAANAWGFDFSAERLTWMSIVDLDQYLVHEVSALSPLSSFIAGWSSCSEGPVLEVADAMPVLIWQAKHGFAMVAESAMTCLCKDLDMTISHADAIRGQSYKHTLALALIARLLPDITESEALTTFLTAELAEDPKGASLIDLVDDQMVQDVVLLGDQSTTKEFLGERKKAIARREETASAIRSFVHQRFAPMVAKAKQSRETQAQKKKQAAALVDARTRWLRSLADDPDSSILQHTPSTCHCFVDHFNGRCLLSARSHGRRSVSWTLRGHAEAVTEALCIMWRWHNASTGECPPAELGIVV